MSYFLKDLLTKVSEEEILRVLTSETPIGYIVLNTDHRVLYASDFYYKFRDLTPEEVIGARCYDYTNNGCLCPECVVTETIKSKKVCHIERKDILENGKISYLNDTSIPIRKEGEQDFNYVLEMIVNRDKEISGIKQRDKDFAEIIHVLSRLLEAKDAYTAKHSETVGELSVRIAEAMLLSPEEILEIDIAACFHDLGKVFIDTKIINKVGKLTPEEWQILQTHPQRSREILERISGFREMKSIVQSHHEWFDGSGYPQGLKGLDIPLGARIIAIADSYDAMTSDRPYRRRMSHEEAMHIINQEVGTHFDPKIHEVFLKVIENKSLPPSRVLPNYKSIFKGIERKLASSDQINKIDVPQISDIIAPKEFVKLLFENAPVHYIVIDDEDYVVYANMNFVNYLNKPENEVIGVKCYQNAGLNERCQDCPLDKVAATGKASVSIKKFTKREKTTYLEVYSIPIKSKEGKQYMVEMIIDCTTIMLLEEQHNNDLFELIKILSSTIKNEKKKISLKEIITKISRIINLPELTRKKIVAAGLLCNVGMVSFDIDKGVSDDEIIKKHAERSHDIFSFVDGYDDVKKMILHHHEHYDGTGGPYGLSGSKIPFGARILAIAEEIFNITDEENFINTTVINHLKKYSGTLFDPTILQRLERSADSL